MHQTIHASLAATIKWKYFTFGITSPDTKPEDAMQMENWFNSKLKSDRWESAASDLLFMACEQLAGIVCVGWTQEEQHSHGKVWIGPDKQVWLEEPLDYAKNPRKYRTPDRASVPSILRQGLDIRTVNPWLIHTWPYNPVGLNERQCHCVFEDMWLSDADLVDGVDELDYDEETVDYLIHNAEQAARDDEPETEVQRRLMLDPQQPNRGGARRCVVITGRLPVVDESGERIVPSSRKVQYLDFEWTMCGKKVLRRCLTPHPVRPYAAVRVIRIPNSLWGEGIVSLTRWLQREATALRRAAHDQIELGTNAPFMGPEDERGMDGIKFQPNGFIRRRQGTVLEQLKVDLTAAEIALGEADRIHGAAAAVSSAQNVSSMSAGKVRKAAEVEFTAGVIKQKFQLYADNVGSDFEEVSRIMLAQYASHAEDGDEAVQPGGKSAAVTAQMLTDHYRIVPQIRTDAINPETRERRLAELRGALMQSPVWQMRIQSGDLSGQYELDRMLVEDMDVADAEQILGPEPPPPPPPGQQQGMMPGMPPSPGGDPGMNGAVPQPMAAIPGVQGA